MRCESALGLALLLFLVPARGEAASALRGKDIAERRCATCHAVGSGGESPEPAAPRFRDLADRYPAEQLGEALAEGLLTGHPMMPEFRFGPDDVRSIILYLEDVQRKRVGVLGR